MRKLNFTRILIIISILLSSSCGSNKKELKSDIDEADKNQSKNESSIYCNLYYTVHLSDVVEKKIECTKIIEFLHSRMRLKIEIINNLDSTITYNFHDFSKANMGTSMFVTLNENDTIDIYRKFETKGVFRIERGKSKIRDFDIYKYLNIRNYSDIKDKIELIKNGKNQNLHLSNYNLKIPVKKHTINFIRDCEFILENEIDK